MKRVSLALAMTLAGAPAFAQSDRDSTDQKRAIVAAQLGAASAVASDSVVDVAPALVLEGATTSKTATGQVGVQLRSWSLTVGVSAPVGDATSPARLADLDGLRNKASGSAALIWSHWNVPDVAAALTAACEASQINNGDTAGCTYLQIKRLAADGSASARAAMKALRQRVKRGTVVFGGMRGKIAPETFTFVNRSSLVADSEAHTSWAGSALAGLLFEDGLMISAAYTRQVSYAAADQSQICEPVGRPGALQCDNHAVGAPSRERANQGSIEVRKAFGESFAVSPKVTYDGNDKVLGVLVPLYVLKSPAGGLTGGVAVGWRSDTRAITAAVIVGEALSLIERH